MTTTTLCTIALGLSMLAFVGTWHGRAHRAHHRHHGAPAWWTHHRVEHALARVGLDHEGRTLVTSALDDLRADGEAAATVRRRVRDQVRNAFLADDVDAGALHAMIDAEAAELAAIGHRFIDRTATILRTLTPEQRARLGRRLHGL